MNESRLRMNNILDYNNICLGRSTYFLLNLRIKGLFDYILALVTFVDVAFAVFELIFTCTIFGTLRLGPKIYFIS